MASTTLKVGPRKKGPPPSPSADSTLEVKGEWGKAQRGKAGCGFQEEEEDDGDDEE